MKPRYTYLYSHIFIILWYTFLLINNCIPISPYNLFTEQPVKTLFVLQYSVYKLCILSSWIRFILGEENASS